MRQTSGVVTGVISGICESSRAPRNFARSELMSTARLRFHSTYLFAEAEIRHLNSEEQRCLRCRCFTIRYRLLSQLLKWRCKGRRYSAFHYIHCYPHTCRWLLVIRRAPCGIVMTFFTVLCFWRSNLFTPVFWLSRSHTVDLWFRFYEIDVLGLTWKLPPGFGVLCFATTFFDRYSSTL